MSKLQINTVTTVTEPENSENQNTTENSETTQTSQSSETQIQEEPKPKEIGCFRFPFYDFSCEAKNLEEAQLLLQIHLESQK